MSEAWLHSTHDRCGHTLSAQADDVQEDLEAVTAWAACQSQEALRRGRVWMKRSSFTPLRQPTSGTKESRKAAKYLVDKIPGTAQS